MPAHYAIPGKKPIPAVRALSPITAPSIAQKALPQPQRTLLHLQRQAGNRAARRWVAQAQVHEPSLLMQPKSRGKQTASTQQRLSSLESRLTEVETGQARSKKQSQAIFQLMQFNQEVMGRLIGWEMAAMDVGSAYALAADNHRGALEERARMEALEKQIYGSVLAIFAQGGLAWLAESGLLFKQLKGLSETNAQVLEDVAQSVTGEVTSAVGPVWNPPVPKPTNTNPQIYQNDRVSYIKSLQKFALGYFSAISKEFTNAPDSYWDQFSLKNQAARYAQWLSEAAQLETRDKLPSVAEMAAAFERLMWARWLPTLREEYEGGVMFSGIHSKRVAYKSPGRAVEERLNVLGITKESGVGDFGWFTTGWEVIKIVDWANNNKDKPPSFINESKKVAE